MDLFKDHRSPEPAPAPAYAPLGGPGPSLPPTTPYETVPAYVPPRPAWASWLDKGDFAKYAFYMGLASGILILLCAFSVALLMILMGFLGADLAWPWVTDPDGAGPRVSEASWSPLVPFMFALWGLLTGGAVLLSALKLKDNPDGSAMPGVVMALGGLLSFLTFGGFFVGGILAILAGALAIAGARTVFTVRSPRVRAHERPPV